VPIARHVPLTVAPNELEDTVPPDEAVEVKPKAARPLPAYVVPIVKEAVELVLLESQA
jgi:hypothetical protein